MVGKRRKLVKRIGFLAVVAVGLAAAAIIGLWSSGSGTASAGDFDNGGLKCYRVRVLGSANPGNRLIYVEDQFEAKNIVVRKPTEFCALALKGGVPPGATAGADPHDLVCYAIKQAPGQEKFQRTEILTEDQFFLHFLQITKPYSLCEQATQEGSGIAGFPGEPFEQFTFKCYKVRQFEQGRQLFEGGRPGKIEIDVFDKFSDPETKRTRLLRPALFCSPIEEKKAKAKTDDIDNARELTPGEEVHVSTISASSSREDPDVSCVDNYGHSVWYTYTPGSDVSATFDTEGSTYDTVLAIFDEYENGSIGAGSELGCNDDKDYPNSGHSRVDVKLFAGETYYIMVGAYGADRAGKLKLHLQTTPFSCIGICGAGESAATAADDTVVSDSSVGSSAGDGLNDLMCYSIAQRAPDAETVITFDQLNSHELQIGRGTMYCLQAEKCLFLNKKPTVAGPKPIICSNDP